MRRGVVFAGLALLAGVASAAEVTKDWKIVVPKQASAVIQYGFDKAAKALRNDLAECAGLKLEIVEAVPKDGSSICLGADLARAAGLSTDGLAWFDNVIAEKDGNLYFFGKRISTGAMLGVMAVTVILLISVYVLLDRSRKTK